MCILGHFKLQLVNIISHCQRFPYSFYALLAHISDPNITFTAGLGDSQKIDMFGIVDSYAAKTKGKK